MCEQARISVRQVRRWESGVTTWPNRDARRVLQALFKLSLEDLGFVRPMRSSNQGEDPPTLLEDAVRRRAFLSGVLAGSVPLFDLEALEHLTAVAQNARHYCDHELVNHLRGALDQAAHADGRLGPHQALPATLGILAVINHAARAARTEIRRDLLILGSRGAEFAAWLHKDGGAPARDTAYWHQQSKEWATFTGDGAMYAYVLLRQAQATDRTDPVRMLDLARAATRGPWVLPPRSRAEAFQQEARALAMTGAPVGEVYHILDCARAALDHATPVTGPVTCSGPLGDSYTPERLMVQTAICYREVGQFERAVSLFQEHLASGNFADRDRAFFTAHLAGALAAAGEPDEAATAALQVLDLAAVANFGQALAELRRATVHLQPHINRPTVQELCQRLAILGD
ncbi:hypothetical protein SAMN05444920_103512 [Nonomuraea solani]|uniref:Uncharacterized protein n=1 Tax=Nonomuraea solani TaxID=1144553 RepID=A0A1H6BNB3_9ACTN|nr:hypothetical protein SAMN05444920_103512 [Nonomuraea solani]